MRRAARGEVSAERPEVTGLRPNHRDAMALAPSDGDVAQAHVATVARNDHIRTARQVDSEHGAGAIVDDGPALRIENAQRNAVCEFDAVRSLPHEGQFERDSRSTPARALGCICGKRIRCLIQRRVRDLLETGGLCRRCGDDGCYAAEGRHRDARETRAERGAFPRNGRSGVEGWIHERAGKSTA